MHTQQHPRPRIAIEPGRSATDAAERREVGALTGRLGGLLDAEELELVTPNDDPWLTIRWLDPITVDPGTVVLPEGTGRALVERFCAEEPSLELLSLAADSAASAVRSVLVPVPPGIGLARTRRLLYVDGLQWLANVIEDRPEGAWTAVVESALGVAAAAISSGAVPSDSLEAVCDSLGRALAWLPDEKRGAAWDELRESLRATLAQSATGPLELVAAHIGATVEPMRRRRALAVDFAARMSAEDPVLLRQTTDDGRTWAVCQEPNSGPYVLACILGHLTPRRPSEASPPR